MSDNPTAADLVHLTVDIVSAYVSNNTIAATELTGLIGTIHCALRSSVDAAASTPEEPPQPAVPIKKSVQKDYIICLEDGKKFKSLKRHLRTHYDLSPGEYRAKWQLDADYPMVAPNYAAARSELARKMGLGQKRKRAK